MSDLSRDIARANPQGGPATVEGLLDAMRPEFAKAIPKTLSVDHFMRLTLNEIRANPQLARCTQYSLLGALMTAARLGLEPGGPLGQFWLTPRNLQVGGAPKGTKALQVVPIIGYKGLRDLAYRAGFVKSIQATLVRKGDLFQRGANEERGIWFDWAPIDDGDEERPWVGVLAVARTLQEGTVWRYLSEPEVMRRKAAGGAGGFGWDDWPEAMALKTGIRALASDLPQSSQFAEAMRVDEAVQEWHPGQAPPPPLLEAGPAEPLPDPEREPERPARRTRAAKPKPQVTRMQVGEVTVEMMTREDSLHIAPLGTDPGDEQAWTDLGLAPSADTDEIMRAIEQTIHPGGKS